MKATPGPPLRFWLRTRRRPSFWLGLFVACFLAWAWWDSCRFDSDLKLSGRGHMLWCVRGVGGTDIYIDEDPWAWSLKLGARRMKRDVWPPGGKREIVALLDLPGIAIPDSLVFFSFLGLWVGWLVLSDRKRQRHPLGAS